MNPVNNSFKKCFHLAFAASRFDRCLRPAAQTLPNLLFLSILGYIAPPKKSSFQIQCC
jgi:hypothetical protein